MDCACAPSEQFEVHWSVFSLFCSARLLSGSFSPVQPVVATTISLSAIIIHSMMTSVEMRVFLRKGFKTEKWKN